MSTPDSADCDAPQFCAQHGWPVVPCPRTCKENAWHHHHNQQGTLWTNPGTTCPTAPGNRAGDDS